MADHGVTAVMLPGTSLYSNIPFADARGALKQGCRLALGTDLSPNSWVESPQLVMSLACTKLGLTPAQALLGFTRNSAAALSRNDVGVLEIGASADFVVHTIADYRYIPYRVGGSYVSRVFKSGREIYSSATSRKLARYN